MSSHSGTSPPSGGMNPTLPPVSKTTAVPPSGCVGNRSRTSSESSNTANEAILDKVDTMSKVIHNLEGVVNQSYSMSQAEVGTIYHCCSYQNFKFCL